MARAPINSKSLLCSNMIDPFDNMLGDGLRSLLWQEVSNSIRDAITFELAIAPLLPYIRHVMHATQVCRRVQHYGRDFNLLTLFLV